MLAVYQCFQIHSLFGAGKMMSLPAYEAVGSTEDGFSMDI